MISANTLVSRAVKRIEDKRFLIGQGRFVADMTVPGPLSICSCPPQRFASARLVSIDVSAACALSGIIAVITVTDIGPAPTFS